MKNYVDVAVIGMSGIFPGAEDLTAFWNNIVNRVDAVQAVPEDRLDAVFFDEGNGVDRFYCQRGGFIKDFVFDPVKFGILPLAVEGTEPDHLLTLQLVSEALDDAGISREADALAQTGIIIGKGNYAGPGATRAIEIVRTGEQLAQLLRQAWPQVTESEIAAIKKEYHQRKGRFGADTVMGLIPNLVASLVANRLDLGGAAYTVDAACASSLIAIDHAMHELASHRCNMVIAGGVHVCQNAAFWSIFSQLGALSRKQQIRPFHREADGLLIGEGCGFVVLKRLDEALREGHRIYAVVKGVGVSSDGAGVSVMSPSVKGQVKAIEQAWREAGLDPQGVGYIEAHGTATPLGDKTELETLQRVFGKNTSLPKAGLGSVKSMIGHAMPAAGIAGFIKTALALYHGTLPPTLHVEEPSPHLAQTRFTLTHEPVDWHQSSLPLRAGVNAFGFGGINAHVVLEGPNIAAARGAQSFNGVSIEREPVRLLARKDREALVKALEDDETVIGEGDYRIAVFEPDAERIKKAIKIVQRDRPWRNRQDIWFTNEPLLGKGGRIAFLFPGLDGLKSGEVDSVTEHFNLPAVENQTNDSGLLNEASRLLQRSRVIDAALRQLGIAPHLNAGHSMGEWLAAGRAGITEEAAVLKLIQTLKPESFNLKGARFLAVGCGYERIKTWLVEIKDIYLSNDNCPQQVILCGTPEAIDTFMVRLREAQIFHQVLPFTSGFHSPFVKDSLPEVVAIMNQIKYKPGHTPLWSATTIAPYPNEQEEIIKLNIDHLVQPVYFRGLIEKLYHQEQVRMFIQVGSGGLIGFVDDTLKAAPYSALAANVPTRSGLGQLKRVVAALFVDGHTVDISFLDLYKPYHKSRRSGMRLSLGLPLLESLDTLSKLSVPAAKPLNEPVTHREPWRETASPVMNAFRQNCDEIVGTQEEILALFMTQRKGGNATTMPSPTVASPPVRKPVQVPLDISLQNTPYLIDHALLRQKPGWPFPEDMDPVIPMTMMLQIFAEIAHQAAPEGVVQKITNMRVYQWMNVAQPFKETVQGEWKSDQTLALNIDKYANAQAEVGSTYTTSQQPPHGFHIGAPLAVDVVEERIYDIHMFHGPAYQGIKKVTAFCEKGITGIIQGSTGKGSLLDNAGQLFGFWLQLFLEKDRIAFPVKIEEVIFYDDPFQQAGEFECTCCLTALTEDTATADFLMKRAGKVWLMIRGWQNRRLEIDQRLWDISLAPAFNLLADEIAPGIFYFYNAYQRVVSWDFILKRYLGRTEKKDYHALLPLKRKERLISRVAAKDAVRAWLNQQSAEGCFPLEFEIAKTDTGQPVLTGERVKGLHLSMAHKNHDAVAIVREGRAVGIDLEIIEPRSDGFQSLTFSPEELTLLQAQTNLTEWLTRAWVAKEAYGKSIGKGLQGNPKKYTITAIHDQALCIADTWITTLKFNNYIIGWTQ